MTSSPTGGYAASSPTGESKLPARLRQSSFGCDEELLSELPPTWTLNKFQEKAKTMLAEFFASGAVADSVGVLRNLLGDCTSEADELGVLAIRAALDRNEEAQSAVVKLLCALHAAPDHANGRKVMDGPSLVRSFEKLFVTWEDIAIDAPHAPQALLEVIHGCITGGAVKQEILTKLPENLLNAGLTKAQPALREMLETVAANLREFKKQAGVCLEEYFCNPNVDEVRTKLTELNMETYHHEFVKKTIVMSFSQNDALAARDATLSLLTELSSTETLSKDDLQWGLTRLLGQLDDLKLDCPSCVDLATEVCVGMVSDELVSVPFLRRCRVLRIGGITGLKVIDGTQRKTPEYHKKFLGTAQFKLEIQTMILEYFNGSDKEEFGRCVRELQPLPKEKSAEMIRKVMTFGMERTKVERDSALSLLVWLHRQDELDSEAIEEGFEDLYRRLPDVLLDVPDAEAMANEFVAGAQESKVLRPDWPDPIEP